MISVVIPLYQQAASIRETVQTVLDQSLPPDEIIVIDDGSTDGGASKIADLAGVTVVRQDNAGVSAARNLGSAHATSEYVAFLDADDVWDRHHLADLRALFDEFPSAIAYGTAYRRVDPRGRERVLAMPETEPFSPPDYFSYCQSHEAPLWSSSVAVRGDVLARVGGFPVGVNAGEDLVTWARLACAGPIALHPRVSATYRLREIAQHRLPAPAEPDLVGQHLEALSPLAPPSFAGYRAAWHRMRAQLYAEAGRTRGAIRELRRAVELAGSTRRDALLVASLAVPGPLRGPLYRRYRARRFGTT